MTQPITVLISSRNRPLYLWACLDALYRFTRHAHRFILLDLASDDLLVEKVIRGFERRRMFSEVIFAQENRSSVAVDLVRHNLAQWAPWFAYVEADVVVEDTSPCWLERMVSIMQGDPRLAMLGSSIDRRDFVDADAVADLRRDEDAHRWRKLLKADSPERQQDVATAGNDVVFRPHNPAGRLLLMRTEAVRQVGIAPDYELDVLFRNAGYDTATAANVRHRHLSLLHVFDYADYDIARRDDYMSSATPSSVDVERR